MAKPKTPWSVELSTPNGLAGDTFHVNATDLDDAIKRARKAAPKGFTTVTGAHLNENGDDAGVVVD